MVADDGDFLQQIPSFNIQSKLSRICVIIRYSRSCWYKEQKKIETKTNPDAEAETTPAQIWNKWSGNTEVGNFKSNNNKMYAEKERSWVNLCFVFAFILEVPCKDNANGWLKRVQWNKRSQNDFSVAAFLFSRSNFTIPPVPSFVLLIRTRIHYTLYTLTKNFL